MAWPNWIPSSASAIKIVLPVPREIFLFEASNAKLVAVKLLPSIVKPAIWPLVAVTLPDITTLPPLTWKLLELISKSPPDPLTNDSFPPKRKFEELTTKVSVDLSNVILAPPASPIKTSPLPSA